MATSNASNVTKRIDVNRRLTYLEMDENFEELKRVIADAANNELAINGKVSTAVYNNKMSTLDSEIAALNLALNDVVSVAVVQALSNDVQTINGQQLNLQDDFDLLEQQFNNISGSITNLETDVSNLETSKQDVLVSGTNIKTINGTSLLGSSNIVIPQGDVTLNGIQTLTNKTLVAPVIESGYTEEVYSIVLGTGGTFDIDPTNGSIQVVEFFEDTTITESLTTGQTVVLRMVNASSYVITWPMINWVSQVGNVAPTLTTADVVVLWKDSSGLYGTYAGSYA